MAGSSAVNLMGRTPEYMVLRQERIDLKHDEGCAVCKRRNTKSVFGGHFVCSDPTRQPIKGEKYCHLWAYDDALG